MMRREQTADPSPVEEESGELVHNNVPMKTRPRSNY